MTEKPKNIGELFKGSFEDFEVKGDSSDWSLLEMKLEKLKFFRFDLTCFNIYYASIIALTFLFSSGILVDYLVSRESSIQIESKEDTKTLQGSIQEESNESAVFLSKDKDPISQKQTESGAKKREHPVVNSNKDNKISNDNKSNKNSKAILLTPAPRLTDTVSADTIIVVPVPIEKKVQKKEPQKKIIYITKQDTVIVVDSVKTKNRRKK